MAKFEKIIRNEEDKGIVQGRGWVKGLSFAKPLFLFGVGEKWPPGPLVFPGQMLLPIVRVAQMTAVFLSNISVFFTPFPFYCAKGTCSSLRRCSHVV